MSSEIYQITTSDAVLRIKKLIAQNQGDKGRLQYIMETIQKGKKLFHSDHIYLNQKIFAEVILVKQTEPSETDEKLKNVKRLISLNFGDPERLRYMFHQLQKNKKLYHSDEKYLESKTEQIIHLRKKKFHHKEESPIPSSLNQKINNDIFFGSISEKITKKQPEKSFPKDIFKLSKESKYTEPTLAPNDKSPIFDQVGKHPHYNLEIENERLYISKLKLEDNQIKIQRDELSQLITYRQEYEIKINHERENLEKESKIAQQEIKDKDMQVEELITNQSKLIQIKTEREVLIDQIKLYKANAEEELDKKQKELENLKIEFENLQNDSETSELNPDKQISDENSNKIKKYNLKKSMRGKLEVSIVAIGMIIGFSAVMMKLAEVWPCDILEILGIYLPSIC